MIRCPSCTSEIPETSRFCSNCGLSVTGEPTTTVTSVPGEPAGSSPSDGRSASRGAGGTMDTRGVGRVNLGGESLGGGRFVPGQMIAERYRIIGLLGKGGMGEVYRADDVKLEQAVALKFLPRELERDGGRLTRFVGEVRTARQVSHANVCRVYDIGEFEGQHYLSMEFVDGEDLASLLHRIGRLSGDKAVEIARQICAGLAAAHARGIVHRDLKPANVMLDGEGQVRITDFGLAALAAEVSGAEVRVGTPAYMSPEQIAGREVTTRSDLYSLGLVLYELFTGKPAFQAASMAELTRMRRETRPTTPSSLVHDLDESVERVILRCLEQDPAERPASALAVSAALPGGDPLAAALAAGETPSPEMVARAGRTEGLRPALAFGALAWIVVGLAVVLGISGKLLLVARVAPDRRPAVLDATARGLLADAGLTEAPADRFGTFVTDNEYLRWVETHDQSPGRWNDVADARPLPIAYLYRESPRPLRPMALEGNTGWGNPPLTVSGMGRVRLDAAGRLQSLEIVPPETAPLSAAPSTPDWGALFVAAGLDPADFAPSTPEWNPLVDCDVRAAWVGHYPERPDTPIRVEAGGWGGEPVWFTVLPPWRRADRMEPDPGRGARDTAVGAILISMLLSFIGFGLFLAWRNLKLGRGDRRGAFRMALYLFVVIVLSWALDAHHQAGFAEIGLVFGAIRVGLMITGIVWIVYMALEPSVRRLWPQAMISWSRLLAGRWRDPLVGRDVLVGMAVGVLFNVILGLGQLVPEMLGRAAATPISGAIGVLDGPRHALALLLNLHFNAMLVPIAFLFLLLILRVVLRRPWLATGAAFALMVALAGLQNADRPLDWVLSALVWVMLIAVIVRLGVLASLFTVLIGNVVWMLQPTTDLSAFWAGASLGILGLLVALAVCAAVLSVGQVSLLAGSVLDD